MKSIKEKAEEHAPYTREDSWNKTQRCIIAQTSFEAGANYVISCIEKEMLSCKEFSQSQLSLIIQFCEQLEETNKG